MISRMKPKVTVLIPNYNGSRYLDHCLGSLVSQTNQNFLCYFLDDGSSDDSVEIARRYQTKLPQMTIRSFSNAGIAANWNRGVALVETQFFSILHCDDGYADNYLSEMLKLMEAYPDSAIGHCASQAIDAESNNIFSVTELYKHVLFLPEESFERDLEVEFSLLLKGDYINCPSVMYRTDAVKRIGQFDEQLRQTLDWDYWFRTLLAGYKICGTNRKLYFYRRHDNNYTLQNSQDLARYREELRCFQAAHRSAVEAGYVAGDISYAGLRNIVLVDLSNALRFGNLKLVNNLSDFLRLELGLPTTLMLGIRLLKSIDRKSVV